MAGQQSSTADGHEIPGHETHSYSPSFKSRVSAALKAFLTAMMGILTILVFGLGLERQDATWLWIAFVCALVSGIFVQLLINRTK